MAGDDWQKYLPPEPGAAAAGDDVDWQKYIPEKTSGWASALRGAAQEATFGYADEIAGALESAFTPKTYKQSRDESRAAYHQAEADNPTAYTAGQVAGGLASLAIPVGGAIGRAASTGAKFARAAGAGAVYGAGKSEAEDVGGVLGDAATGAALGGGIYGAGRLVGAGVGKLGQVAAGMGDSPVAELAKRVIGSKIKATVAGGITGALGGDALTGAGVGLALDAAAPLARKAASWIGGRGLRKVAAAEAPAAESAGIRWAREAGALERPELAPATSRSSLPRPPLGEPAVPTPAAEPPAKPAAPGWKSSIPNSSADSWAAHKQGRPRIVPDGADPLATAAAEPPPARAQPSLARDPKNGQWVSVAKAKKMGIEAQPVVPKAAEGIPAQADPAAPPTTLQSAPRSGQDRMAELKALIAEQRKGTPVVPAEDRSTTQALANIVSTQSREGNIAGLRHYPVAPDVAFRQYLGELPKSTGAASAKARNKALGDLVIGMRNGGEPGSLIYQARAAGVPDEAIMRAAGVRPVQRTAREAAAAAELVPPAPRPVRAPRGGPAAPATPAAPPPGAPPTASASPPAPPFADAVKAAMSQVGEGGRFGRRKVFISSVYDQVKSQFPGMSLDDFKRRLVQAQKAGDLTMARADLVGAMDPARVKASEVQHLEARYNFLESDQDLP